MEYLGLLVMGILLSTLGIVNIMGNISKITYLIENAVTSLNTVLKIIIANCTNTTGYTFLFALAYCDSVIFCILHYSFVL